jgi:predicted Rossmann fold flavoprotein
MPGTKQTLIVIGGGAAGFFCAVNAARLTPLLEVIIVEKSNKVLGKVRISGGGRCNVTHACFDIAEMVKKYPRGRNFVKKTFHHFFTGDTIHWFEERGVELKTEADGRMFPASNTSQTIVDCLVKELNTYGVQLMLHKEVTALNNVNSKWQVHFSNNSMLEANFVCVACGGYPKSTMFEWLTKTGHTIEAPVPSLFTFNMPAHPITKLMGVGVEHAAVKIRGTKLEEAGPVLITHWGLSGPAILRLSAWGARQLETQQYTFTAVINWMPSFTEQTLSKTFAALRHEMAAQKIYNKNPFALPQRLWEYLCEQSGVITDKRWADLPAATQNKLVKNICAGEFDIKGKTTFKEEFVTAGGVQLSEVDAGTMMSKVTPQLYFAGEILDVDGITGGFNFQHAWTSGWMAATAIAKAAALPDD